MGIIKDRQSIVYPENCPRYSSDHEDRFKYKNSISLFVFFGSVKKSDKEIQKVRKSIYLGRILIKLVD